MIHSVAFESGGAGVPVGLKSAISGKRNGSSDSGIACARPSPSSTIGNGSPQYRWRENSQSRSL